jgi:hypothetical protein
MEQLQAQLQESEESVLAMQAEAAAAKAKLREMELARMSAVQVLDSNKIPPTSLCNTMSTWGDAA